MCWQLLSEGKIKVFRTLGNFMNEIRLYRRDEKGRVVKSNDHLMDAFRYLILTGRNVARTKPEIVIPNDEDNYYAVGGNYRKMWG
jgi:hypothetical protein